MPVESSYGQVHQLPTTTGLQRCLERAVQISPQPRQCHERIDFFDNAVLFYSIHHVHTELEVLSQSVVETNNQDDLLGQLPPEIWQQTTEEFRHSTEEKDVWAQQFCLDSPRVRTSEPLREFARPCFEPDATLAEATFCLTQKIFSEFEFSPEATDVSTPIDEVLESRAGVCQDFAHLMIASLRSLGVPARYVSGYLETVPPAGQTKLTGADQSHAWVDVYVGNGRWLGVDPTNNQAINHRYVVSARGRDYGDVAPLKGVVFTNATQTKMKVSVDVLPLG